jgi:hypothetical protein
MIPYLGTMAALLNNSRVRCCIKWISYVKIIWIVNKKRYGSSRNMRQDTLLVFWPEGTKVKVKVKVNLSLCLSTVLWRHHGKAVHTHKYYTRGKRRDMYIEGTKENHGKKTWMGITYKHGWQSSEKIVIKDTWTWEHKWVKFQLCGVLKFWQISSKKTGYMTYSYTFKDYKFSWYKNV